VTFEVPLALLGLASVPILILLDRIRRRPTRTLFDSLLLYECAAAVLLSLAAAGPLLPGETVGRRVAVLFDEGPHMAAEGVREASLREWARLLDALDDHDRIIEFRTADDVSTAAAKLPPVDLRVVVTDRPDVAGPNLVVIGRTASGPGKGIDAVELAGDELWFAVATDEDPRPTPVRVGDLMVMATPGQGNTVPFRGDRVRIEMITQDSYKPDNACEVERIRVPARDETGSRYVSAALFRAGLKA
jgi:hypothetical protein